MENKSILEGTVNEATDMGGGGLAIYVSNTKFTETAINILTDISEGETPENGG